MSNSDSTRLNLHSRHLAMPKEACQIFRFFDNFPHLQTSLKNEPKNSHGARSVYKQCSHEWFGSMVGEKAQMTSRVLRHALNIRGPPTPYINSWPCLPSNHGHVRVQTWAPRPFPMP